MGFWSWLTGKRRGWQTIAPLSLDQDFKYVDVPGPGRYLADIVGESHYQQALDAICGGKTEDGHHKIVKAILVCEDNNPYDSEAVRIDIEGKIVGYLDRHNAHRYRVKLKEAGFAGVPGVCSAKIVGGWNRGRGDEGSYGVKLDLGVHYPRRR